MTVWYHKRALLYVVQAAKVATKRGSKTLSLEDLLFLMRHSPVKVWQNLNTVVEKFLQDDFSFAAGAKVGEVPDRPWSFHHVKVLQLKFHPIEWNMIEKFHNSWRDGGQERGGRRPSWSNHWTTLQAVQRLLPGSQKSYSGSHLFICAVFLHQPTSMMHLRTFLCSMRSTYNNTKPQIIV